MSGSNIPNAAEGGRLAARPMTHNVVFDEAFPGDGLPAPIRVLRAASGVLRPLRGLSAFERHPQNPDGSHAWRLRHQQTPTSRSTMRRV